MNSYQKNRKVNVSFTIEAEKIKIIKEAALENNLSSSAFVENIIDDYLEKKKIKELELSYKRFALNQRKRKESNNIDSELLGVIEDGIE